MMLVFVTCQTNDDIPHILNFSGEQSLVIGTDYGHSDSASEVKRSQSSMGSKGSLPR